MNQQAAREEVQLQVADGGGSEPIWRIEHAVKSRFDAIGGELFVQLEVHLGIKSLDLKAELITDASRKPERFVTAASELFVEQPIVSRQRLTFGGDDLAHRLVGQAELEQMAGVADRQMCLNSVANHGSSFVNRQQFGMHGAAQNREIQLRNIWPHKADWHDHTFVEPETDERATAAILVVRFEGTEAGEQTISRR